MFWGSVDGDNYMIGHFFSFGFVGGDDVVADILAGV